MAFIHQRLRLQHNRTRAFHFTIKMRGAVLQRLELADDAVELLAGFQIIERHVHGACANAHHFGGCPNAARVQHFGKHSPAAVNVTNDSVGIHLNTVEFHMRGHGGIDQTCRLHRQARRILVDGEQCQAVGLSHRACGPCGDDQHVRRRALHNKLLVPGQFKAIATAFGNAGNFFGPVLYAFFNRNADNRFARQNAGEPAVTHRLVGQLQRLDSGNRCRQKGRR